MILSDQSWSIKGKEFTKIRVNAGKGQRDREENPGMAKEKTLKADDSEKLVVSKK